MREISGNLWSSDADVICVTTNGVIKRDGTLVMGAGVAKQAALRYPELPSVFAAHVRKYGNTPCAYTAPDGRIIVSLPTKHDWRKSSDLRLIITSLVMIRCMFLNQTVALPRPGCSNGGLKWSDVQKYVSRALPEDRFTIVDFSRI